jgi:PAS domain S-box-containing protein
VALVPIRANAEILGLLQLNYRRKDALTLDEVRGFEELCSMIGLALRRQQAEEALRETEQKFAAAFRFSPAVITLTDVAGGFRYVDVNDAFERVVGYSRAEAIGRTPADLGIWADPRDFAEATSRLRQDGRLRDFEFHFRRKDGEIRTGIISAVPVEIKGSQYSIGSTIDITDRKQAEEALRQSQALLGAVIDGTTDAVFAKDDQGRYVMFNRAAERFTGQPAAGVLGNDDRSLFPPAEAAMVMAGDRRVIEGGTPVTYEEIVTTADGRQTTFLSTKGPLLDAGGQPYGLFGISRDITERKRLEEQLLTILKAVESTSDAVGISDAEGRHYYQNASASKLFGYVTAEEMAAAGGGAAVVKDPEVAREMFARIMSGASWTGELEMVTKDGRVFPAYERADAIRDAEGKIIGLVGIVTDITGRKRAEAEREHLQLQLAQAQKMESIGRLAGGVAHDFNNLLTVINGYSQLALARLSAGDPLRGSLTEINRAGERAAGLTRQLLAFSRKQVLQPRVLDLNRVVGEMRAMLERLMGEDVEVHFALGPESPLVRADPHQLEQTVMNLAVNARDAMPRGGRLLVETALVDLDESYAAAHADARAGRYALLAVSDTGAGMDEATRQRIFEPFFTTKGPGQGAGLGLSTVQGIVVQSGGFINVYSEPGQGTTLKIYLPALAGVAAEAGKPEAVPAPRGSETILLVEDQEEVRDFAATVLKAYGYRVIPASNAGEAILICERESTHFHMVLTDVVMPHTSGRELASRLEKLRPGIKTLFMSGYTDNVIGRHGVLDEGAELIQKPFSPAELARKVRTVLGPPGSNAPDPLKQSQADPAS